MHVTTLQATAPTCSTACFSHGYERRPLTAAAPGPVLLCLQKRPLGNKSLFGEAPQRYKKFSRQGDDHDAL